MASASPVQLRLRLYLLTIAQGQLRIEFGKLRTRYLAQGPHVRNTTGVEGIVRRAVRAEFITHLNTPQTRPSIFIEDMQEIASSAMVARYCLFSRTPSAVGAARALARAERMVQQAEVYLLGLHLAISLHQQAAAAAAAVTRAGEAAGAGHADRR
ncbi:hypothetical protein LTR08_006871 [Meristemomyces frigidus]|nr:hypothetical protein LTR08_006871 [Meristemomyces frigidus]